MKKASSLIELVIAIIVMGIAVMALPMMLSTTQRNNLFALQQESILALRTQIGDIVTYRWDENSEQNDTLRVLDTNSTNVNLQRYPDTNSSRRVGHVNADKRRKFFSVETDATTPANLGMSSDGDTIPDDIDDFDNQNSKLIQSSETTNLDYRFDFNVSVNITYISDNYTYISGDRVYYNLDTISTSTVSTSIKLIELNATGNSINNFKLKAFSSNIGANELLRRTF